MADDLLPIDGHQLHGQDRDSSDSDSDDEGVGQMQMQMIDFINIDDEDEISDEGEEDADASEHLLSPPDVTFDKALPGTHSYLGDDLEDVRGRTVHDDESYLNLSLLSLPGIVLMPGQTLPLHLFQPSVVAMMRRVIDKDKTFGLVTLRHSHEEGPTIASIGTTAEILAIKEENDESTGIITLRIKAIGRQRFEVKESRRQSDGNMIAKVCILSERILGHPLEGAQPPSHQRVLQNVTNENTGSGDMPVSSICGRRRRDKLSCADFTWWPPWVYRQYDVDHCMRRVKQELMSLNESLRAENMPCDATEFSYWVASNLPLDDSLKLHLLRLDSAIQRLRCELSIMQKCTILCCRTCGQLIAHKSDVFSMAVEGPMGAYVNPGGYVHETLTIYKSQGLNLIGRPSTENSWFPGYAWTIAQCRHCSQHMGWKFTAAQKKLQPEKFWGLTRSALLPGLQNEDENSEAWLPSM